MNKSIDELRQELADLDREYEGQKMPDDAAKRWNDINHEIDELGVRRERLAELARNPRAQEGTFPTRAAKGVRFGDDRAQGDRDEALRSLDNRADLFSAEAGDKLTDLIERDHGGVDSRYLAAVSDPAYERAVARKLLAPDGAQSEMTPEERKALQRVGESMAERALSIGDGTGGAGLAAPIAIDPTIMLTSDGEINPIRQLATVTPITTSEWRGIASQGVEASFAPELTEVGDGTPTLVQPVVRPEKAQLFVPFSIEAGQDWGSLQAELGRLFADAKDVVEADAYVNGTGSPQPQGLVVGGTATGGTALDIGGIYATQEALPPRFQPRARWLASNATTNTVHRFVAKGDETEAALMSEDRTSILGNPVHEVSTLGTATPVVYGDIGAAFRIVDRVGLTIELVPHLLGSSQRPLGARGLYGYWRTSSLVQVPNAIRVLDNS